MDHCVFCKIAQGLLKSDIVYQDELFVAFRDIHPVAPVHLLIIPRHHVESLNSLEDADYAMLPDLYRAIGKLTNQLGIRDTGYRVITNTGLQGGQTVSHLHFHLIGGRALPWSF